MSINFEGRVAIVTGAANGLGKSHALSLAKLGAKVVVNDFGGARDGTGGSSEAAEKVVAEIKAAGGEAIANGADVSSEEQVDAMVKQTLDQWGRIDILVNNAGILRDGFFHKMTYEDFDAVVKVHLYGSFNTSRAAADYFREQESGALVHMTSTSGLIGNYAQANYAAAKLGIAAFSKSVALDLKRWNVRSNCIAPFAWSRMISSIKTDTPEQKARVEKIKEMTPAKVAPMACFLMSDRSVDVTGQIFAVRKNEIFLFNQPRPVRSVHSGDGWTADEIAERAIPALKSQFTPLEVSADVFSWDPV
ncbi:MAG: SDR family NAD(P)-dependent oxidoreductase [Nitratireductor sp.]